ncbi:DUF3240 domain-containing protein [Novosphingobium kaempferiae]|uniref:DUF3240 domain-containing protein n=1 Tax=Novosphingobium kaempferiae TaxID=2896849 RepID=UPI001E519BBA|nr:DUF3240 domain-containing protein [Novosphingobium kaempferiae]
MSRVVLTLLCGVQDAEAIAAALGDCLHAPVHMRREAVLGRDFDDAATVERVAGTLARMAVEVETGADRVAAAVDAAKAVRRSLPFRWRTVAVLAGGRVA